MSINLIIIICTIVVVLALFIGMPFVMKFLGANNIPIQNILDSTKQISDIAAQLVNSLNLDPKTKGFLQLATETVQIAVRYAEQLYLSGQVAKEERKAKALEFVKMTLHDAGIDITPEQEVVVNGIIEAAVFALPKTSEAAAVKLAKVN